MATERVIEFLSFHDGQKTIYRSPAKRKVIRAGRRFGKTTMLEQAAGNWAAQQMRVGWFAPSYKILLPSFKAIRDLLQPVTVSSSKTDSVIQTLGGGLVEFWTLDNPDAGRSRKYHKVIIDEGSLVKKGMRDIWEQAIEPTLLDYDGDAIMAGTPKGVDDDNFFYLACTDKSLGWEEHHAPTKSNPNLSMLAYERIIEGKPPLVVQQEYLADFVDWSAEAFLDINKLLVDGVPVSTPKYCDFVFAVADTALKGGTENDGTGFVYFAYQESYGEHRMWIVDWDVTQIKASLLTDYMPSVYDNLERMAKTCNARLGNQGVFMEDEAMGAILNQKAETEGWDMKPIKSVLTVKGKDERAVMASGHHFQGKCKITKEAYDKTATFKQKTANHLWKQIAGFHLADPKAHKRADDLFDCYIYGLIIAFGNYNAL